MVVNRLYYDQNKGWYAPRYASVTGLFTRIMTQLLSFSSYLALRGLAISLPCI